MTATVLQCDREAAACSFEENGAHHIADRVRAGEHDTNPRVLAFARHRHDSTRDLVEAALPDALPGHWSTANGREMAERYANKPRPHEALTDMEIANQLFLQSGDIVSQTDAKERIRWLSVHLALANARLATLQGTDR